MTPAPTADWRTIPDILNAQADARAKAPALFGTDGTFVNYEVLRNETQALASTLSALGPQETRLRMGVVMPNGLDISVVLLAAARQGIAVPFNPARTAVEFEAQFTATAVDYVLVPADVQTPALDAAAALSIPVVKLSMGRAPEAAPPTNQTQKPTNPDDIRFDPDDLGFNRDAQDCAAEPPQSVSLCTGCRPFLGAYAAGQVPCPAGIVSYWRACRSVARPNAQPGL